MKLIVSIENENLKPYMDHGADGFLLPLASFSSDYQRSYTLDGLLSLRKKYKNTLLFVVMNEMIFNKDLEEVERILKVLETEKFDGILFYDWAIYQIHQKNKMKIPLIFHQTHMLTNQKMARFLYQKGLMGGVLANELTLEEIKEIAKEPLSLFQLLVGYPPAALSKRKLLTNFYKTLEKEGKKELKIFETSTKIPFYVKETEKSTSFLYGRRLNLISYYETLNDYGIAYGILKQDDLEEDVFLKVLSLYHEGKSQEEIDNLLGRNSGFLKRKTIFKVKK